MRSFCGETPEKILSEISHAGFSSDNAISAARNYYRRGIHNFGEMDNLPLRLRELMKKVYSPELNHPQVCEQSADLTRKYFYTASHGKVFESVLIPERKRLTLCVSTQSGCRFGCKFCRTGETGFSGNLTAGEIVSQVLTAGSSGKITHIVFMGMGEPLDNVENVIEACRIMTAEWGLAISPRHITVSTVGLMPAVSRFLHDSACNLTLSLFSPFSGERAKFIPAEITYPAISIINEIKGFKPARRRRFSIAYVLIRGLNDTEKHLFELVSLFAGTGIRINLIQYNPGGRDDRFLPSTTSVTERFRELLNVNGVYASIRRPRGLDISAACGMLAGKKDKNENRL